MEQEVDPQKIVIGVIISFLITAPVYIFWTIFGIYLMMTDLLSNNPILLPFFKLPYFLDFIAFPLLFIAPTLIFNTIAFLMSKNKSRKRGILMGCIIILILAITMYYGEMIEDKRMENATESTCLKMSNESKRDTCLEQVAQKVKDISLCNQITGEGVIKYNCIVKVANQLQDPSYCDKLNNNGDRNQCLWNSSRTNTDPSFCDKIDFDSLRDRMIKINEATGGHAFPFSSIELKENCYFDALEIGNSLNMYKKYCPSFKDVEHKKQCESVLNIK